MGWNANNRQTDFLALLSNDVRTMFCHPPSPVDSILKIYGSDAGNAKSVIRQRLLNQHSGRPKLRDIGEQIALVRQNIRICW